MADDDLKFRVDDARILWPNFAGAATKFKEEGHRSFNVVLDKATADKMAIDGWNVKCKLPDEEDAEEFCFIEVVVKYRNRKGEKTRPPKIVMITGNNRTMLTEDTVEMLDWADIKKIDLIARAYEWAIGGKTGLSAYLQTMYVTVNEDELDAKYAPQKREDDE